MKRRLILTAPLALASCSSILPQQKYIARINWPLAPQPPTQSAPNPAGPVLLVRDITAAPGLDQQGIQILQPDGSLAVDYYNLWAVNPADATTEALLTWLEASGNFAAVISPGSRLTASLILEGELTQLTANLATQQATAILTLVLIQNSNSLSATSLPLAQQRIIGTAPLTNTTPQAEVTAQRAALADALRQAVALVGRFVG